MIVLTALDGQRLALNADLIERVDEEEGTVVTMVGGSRHTVAESVATLVDMMARFRAGVLVAATKAMADSANPAGRSPSLRLLPGLADR
jgi:flagellar protein FlbD